MDKIKFDERLFKEMNIGILEQNITKEEMSYYAAGYYKGLSLSNNGLWFAFGGFFSFTIIIFTIVLLNL